MTLLFSRRQAESRASLIARAQVWTATDIPSMDVRRGPRAQDAFAPGATVTCDYLDEDVNGNSPKFQCRVGPGDDVKVKYGGSNGEVYGEVAATRLLWALGFGADRMYPVRVICRGCPDVVGGQLLPDGNRLIVPAVVERRMPAAELPGALASGWSWTELDLIDEQAGGATRAERDALKLLAAFIQHTDTKPEQQRLVCAEEGARGEEAGPEGPPVRRGNGADTDACERPFMMLNDVGLTFGRANVLNANAIGSVNLTEWANTPVWKGTDGCVANVAKSFSGTLKDPVISEDGRRFLAGLLAQLTESQRHDLFETARVDLRPRSPGDPDSGSATAADWVRVFNQKEEEVASRRCLDPWSSDMPIAFGVEPVLWVQSWASPALTRAMNAVSLLGYTPAYSAFAVVLAFGYRLRAGAGLLLLIALTAALNDTAKIVVSLPRPDAVDARVQSLALFQQANDEDSEPRGSADPVETFGFPSGHVAATTAFLIGLALLFRWRWAWRAMLIWVPLMAISRMYLGRHFAGDVLGGVAVGTIAAAIAVLWWKLPHLEDPARGWRVARRALYTGAGLAALALIAGLPPAYESGRLIGFAVGALLVARAAPPDDQASPGIRVRRIALASLIYLVTWWGTTEGIEGLAATYAPVGALIAGALPAAVLLPGPLYLERCFVRQKASI